MNLDRVSSGENCPDDIYVIVEIPSHSDPVKYEVDKHTGAMFVDRFMTTAMHYPCNYGYIPHTLSKDGDPIEVLVLTPVPLISGSKEEILDSIEMYKNAPEKPHFRS